MESNYQKLTVRQKWMDLAQDIYSITKKFPTSELYGIVSQMRRCSLSIPSNIAEWNQRNTPKEHINFLFIAKWSAAELETQIILSQRLAFITRQEEQKLLEKVDAVLRMLSGLITSIQKSKV